MRKLVIALAIGTAAVGAAALAQDNTGSSPHRGGWGMGIMRADANGDGIVTRDEYQAQVDARFARMDANGDGKLDADEGPAGGRGRMRHDATPPPTGNGAPLPPPPPAAVGMTRDQFRSRAMARFDRLDLNHDGKVDQGEMQTMMAMRSGDTPPPPPPGATPPQ